MRTEPEEGREISNHPRGASLKIIKGTISALLIMTLGLPLSAQAIKFKIATIAPDGTSWMRAMRQGAKEVAERTQNRVTLTFYPGGVMGNDKSVLRKLRIGQLHGGAITAGGLANIYPDIQVYSLPFLFRSLVEVDYVRSKMDPLLTSGLLDKGYVSYGISEGGFAYLMTQQPIKQVSDLQQQKIWSPEGDQISYKSFSAIGVSAVPLPLADVLTGLQTGLIDSVSTSPVGAIALQWHTRVRHVTDIPLLYLYGTLIIKQTALNKISPQDRNTLREIMEATFKQLNRKNRQDNQSARKALKQQGIRFNQPQTEHPEQWQEMFNTVRETIDQDSNLSSEALEQIKLHLAEIRAKGS